MHRRGRRRDMVETFIPLFTKLSGRARPRASIVLKLVLCGIAQRINRH